MSEPSVVHGSGTSEEMERPPRSGSVDGRTMNSPSNVKSEVAPATGGSLRSPPLRSHSFSEQTSSYFCKTEPIFHTHAQSRSAVGTSHTRGTSCADGSSFVANRGHSGQAESLYLPKSKSTGAHSSASPDAFVPDVKLEDHAPSNSARRQSFDDRIDTCPPRRKTRRIDMSQYRTNSGQSRAQEQLPSSVHLGPLPTPTVGTSRASFGQFSQNDTSEQNSCDTRGSATRKNRFAVAVAESSEAMPFAIPAKTEITEDLLPNFSKVKHYPSRAASSEARSHGPAEMGLKPFSGELIRRGTIVAPTSVASSRTVKSEDGGLTVQNSQSSASALQPGNENATAPVRPTSKSSNELKRQSSDCGQSHSRKTASGAVHAEQGSLTAETKGQLDGKLREPARDKDSFSADRADAALIAAVLPEYEDRLDTVQVRVQNTASPPRHATRRNLSVAGEKEEVLNSTMRSNQRSFQTDRGQCRKVQGTVECPDKERSSTTPERPLCAAVNTAHQSVQRLDTDRSRSLAVGRGRFVNSSESSRTQLKRDNSRDVARSESVKKSPRTPVYGGSTGARGSAMNSSDVEAVASLRRDRLDFPGEDTFWKRGEGMRLGSNATVNANQSRNPVVRTMSADMASRNGRSSRASPQLVGVSNHESSTFSMLPDRFCLDGSKQTRRSCPEQVPDPARGRFFESHMRSRGVRTGFGHDYRVSRLDENNDDGWENWSRSNQVELPEIAQSKTELHEKRSSERCLDRPSCTGSREKALAHHPSDYSLKSNTESVHNPLNSEAPPNGAVKTESRNFVPEADESRVRHDQEFRDRVERRACGTEASRGDMSQAEDGSRLPAVEDFPRSSPPNSHFREGHSTWLAHDSACEQDSRENFVRSSKIGEHDETCEDSSFTNDTNYGRGSPVCYPIPYQTEFARTCLLRDKVKENTPDHEELRVDLLSPESEAFIYGTFDISFESQLVRAVRAEVQSAKKRAGARRRRKIRSRLH